MNPHPMIKISLRLNPKKEKELDKIQAKRKILGYPQVGIKLKAIKSGIPDKNNPEGRVTKGKEYTVIDNLDLISGYFHIESDNYGCVVLTSEILKEYFGIELQINPSVR